NRRQFIKELGLSAAALAFIPNLVVARGRGGLELQSEPKNVVILGGGLAGLSAAYELKKIGHKVTILEARKFPGGRGQTIRDFSDGLYAEAGPIAFPESHSFTVGYARDFGLTLRPSYKLGLDAIANIGGQVFRFGGSSSAIPLDLKARERQAGVVGMPLL